MWLGFDFVVVIQVYIAERKAWWELEELGRNSLAGLWEARTKVRRQA